MVRPEKERLETIREIRASHPDTKIIAISGNLPTYLHIATKLGAERTLSKPFSIQEILEAVQEVLARP
jgi:DNA-binding NarL/FixJ family response regulator